MAKASNDWLTRLVSGIKSTNLKYSWDGRNTVDVYKQGNNYVYYDGNDWIKIASKADTAILDQQAKEKSPKTVVASASKTNDIKGSVSAVPDYNYEVGAIKGTEAEKQLADKMGVTLYNTSTATKKEETKTESTTTKEPDYTSAINNAVSTATAPLLEKITQLESQMPRKIGADEAAELYDIDVNYDNILRDYNQATNDYYNTAIGDLSKYRDQMQNDSALYNQEALRQYLNSYQNAAPTASRKGATAASALLNMLGNSADMATADSTLGQNIANYKEQRTAELANNPYLAKEYENNVRKYLSTLSTGLHSADVQKHVGELSSYATEYAAKRNGLASAAMGNAYQYQGLANAAGTRAQANANNTIQKMNQFYNYYLGSGYADSAVASALKAQSTTASKK